MNIVEKWIERAREKYPSLAAGIRQLNMKCGLKLQQGQIYRIRDGKAKLPECVHNQMLADVLPTILGEAKAEIGVTDYLELLDSLSVPVRK